MHNTNVKAAYPLQINKVEYSVNKLNEVSMKRL